MSQKHQQAKTKQRSHQPSTKRPIHHDWRLWAVVLLMLAAMGIYLATVDEAVAPGVNTGPEVPAAP